MKEKKGIKEGRKEWKEGGMEEEERKLIYFKGKFLKIYYLVLWKHNKLEISSIYCSINFQVFFWMKIKRGEEILVIRNNLRNSVSKIK